MNGNDKMEQNEVMMDDNNNNNNNNTSKNDNEVVNDEADQALMYSVLENLNSVEMSLSELLEEHQSGEYGYITRDWGFFAPNGLGGKLSGKFQPWEDKLSKVKDFFWPPEAYLYMEEDNPTPPHSLPKEAEQLHGNLSLHYYLLESPHVTVELEESDLVEYRTAARVFLLLGTLSHLCGNSAPDPKTAPLPVWIEDPLRMAAKRLKIAPTLTGHFLVQENWIWRDHTTIGGENATNMMTTTLAETMAAGPSHHPVITTTLLDKDLARTMVRALLQECQLADRRYRFTVYKNCFVGSQAIDVLRRFASSREEAVRLGRRINAALSLFSHVTHDHLLKDKMLFYRFRKKWRPDLYAATTTTTTTTTTTGASNMLAGGAATTASNTTTNHEGEITSEIKGISNNDDDVDSENDDQMDENESVMRSSLRSLTRQSTEPSEQKQGGGRRFNIGKVKRQMRARSNGTPSSGSVVSLEKEEAAGSIDVSNVTWDGVEQESGLAVKFMNVVTMKNPKRGSLSGYSSGNQSVCSERSTGNNNRPPDQQTLSGLERQVALGQAWQHSGFFMEDEHNQESLQDMIAAITAMSSVTIKDRRFRLKIYRKCFLGSQLIDVLLEQECARSRPEALRMALKINARYNIIEHVCQDHELKDDHLFYRFTSLFKQMIATDEQSALIGSYTGEQKWDVNMEADILGISTRYVPDVIPTDAKNGEREGSVYSAVTLQSNFEIDDAMFALDEPDEFCFDNIEMLYPAFQNNHERVNQLVPACMGFALRELPITLLDVLSTMRDLLSARLNGVDIAAIGGTDGTEDLDFYHSDVHEDITRLSKLLYKIAFSLSRCKEQFQLMSTDPTKRTFNSKHVSIRQTQPLSVGVLVRRTKGGEPLPSKGTSGTQFPYLHLLDWMLGRYQYGTGNEADNLVSKISSSIDDCYPVPQREYIRRLSGLGKFSNLRGFLDLIGHPKQIVVAFNHLVECYAGQGGLLTAHCRKLYSYMHNDVQASTSGTIHAGVSSLESRSGNGCPHGNVSAIENNHRFANMMFKAMQGATEERWRLRVAPLMTQVKKVVYSTSESGGFTTVALDLGGKGLRYEYGDVVRVILPNCDKTTIAWTQSLACDSDVDKVFLRLGDLPYDVQNGWGWKELWEALGWMEEEEKGRGVPLATLARYIEQAQIRDDVGKARWVNNPLDLCGSGKSRLFAVPPSIPSERIASLEPVSPRVYSVSGVESDRVFLLVSMPLDGARHHGYERMADQKVEHVHCSFAPATFFLVPPINANLVCVASGTGISPFVGLVDAIGARPGTYTIAHQCKSSDLFLSNCQAWLDFTAQNPGAVVMGFISGDRSRRNCPMRYVISNGLFEDTSLLGRHNSRAYYFQSPDFLNRLKEVHTESGLNLAYCCGGVQSAIEPLRKILNDNNWTYEFTVESYGVTTTLESTGFSSQIGGTIVDLGAVSHVHEGGDQILRHIQNLELERQQESATYTPDHSDAFWQLHPHAYNLHRCLRTPLDADFAAFAAFLNRQDASKSVIAVSAEKYAQVALASPEDSKVVRIAAELQSSAMTKQVNQGDKAGAKKSAAYLEALLQHVGQDDENAQRWRENLEKFRAASWRASSKTSLLSSSEA